MTDDLVRDKLRLYADDVAPAQLPPFTQVSRRRRRRRAQQAVVGGSIVAVVATVAVVAMAMGGGGKTPITATPSPLTAASLEKALVGSSWRLVAVDSPDTYWRASSESKASLSFAPTGFQAGDGCQSLHSALAFGAGGAVTFGGKDVERATCSPAGPSQDTFAPSLFYSALDGRLTANLSDRLLTLTGGATVLTLTSGSRTYDDVNAGDKLQALLTSHTWPLQMISSGDKTWKDPQKAVLQFGAHGYTINPDCNDHSGQVTYAGGRLVMQNLMETAMGCAAGETVQASSADVIDALFSGPVSVEEDAGTLMLWNDDTQLELHQGPAPKADPGLDLPAASTPSADPVPSSLSQQLIGPKWMLRSITVEGKDIPKAEDYGASLTFTDKGYAVDDGCNFGGGSVGYLKDAVTLTAASQTMAACPDRSTVTAAEKYAGTFAVQRFGTVLTLTNPASTFVFDAQGHGAFASQLVGTNWQLSSWSINGHAQQIAQGSEPSLDFKAGVLLSVTAKDGCNTHTWRPSFDGASVTLVDHTQTVASCAGARGALGDAYARLDGKSLSVTVTTDRLTLAGAGVVLQLLSNAASGPAPSAGSAPDVPWQGALPGTVWQLMTVDGPGAGDSGHWDVPANSGTLAFGTRRWDASDTCNDHMGSLLYGSGAATGGSLMMAPGASSVVLCEKPLVQRLEQLERTDLTGTVTVTVSGKRLTMHSGPDTLVFGEGASGPTAAHVPADGDSVTDLLTSWTWKVQSWTVNRTSGAVDPQDAHPPTLIFGYETAATSGCGAMTATAAYRETSVAFSGRRRSRSAVPAAEQQSTERVRSAVLRRCRGQPQWHHADLVGQWSRDELHRRCGPLPVVVRRAGFMTSARSGP